MKSEWEKFLDKLEKIYNTPKGKGHVGPTLEEFAYDYANDIISKITETDYNKLKDENKKQTTKIVDLQKQIQNINDNDNKIIIELKYENSRLKKDLLNFENVNDSVKKHIKTINELKKQNKELNHDNELKDNTISQLTENETNLKIENNKLTKNNSDLTSDLNSITKKYETNEDLLKTNSLTIAQLKEHNENLTKITERLEDENMKQKKEVSAARNDYKHAVNRNDKLQDEINSLQQESRKYTYAVGQIKKMSFLDRIFKRYPKEVKELNPYIENNNKDDEYQL